MDVRAPDVSSGVQTALDEAEATQAKVLEDSYLLDQSVEVARTDDKNSRIGPDHSSNKILIPAEDDTATVLLS